MFLIIKFNNYIIQKSLNNIIITIFSKNFNQLLSFYII